MNPHRRSARSLAVLLASLALGAPIGSQPPPPPPQPGPTFEETIEVNVVNVTVRVMNRDGIPITGLTREDFEILDEGKPVEISNFYETRSDVDYDQVRRDRESQARSRAPAPAPPAAPAADPGAPVRHVAIFVNNANLHPRNRQLVFRGLRDFLHDRVGPHDRIMVVAFNNEYEVVQPFTDSNAEVVQAVDSLEKAPSEGPHTLAERRMVIRDLQSSELAGFKGEAAGNAPAKIRAETESRNILRRIDTLARETYDRNRNTIGALSYLMGSLAGLPEPKAILYLSDGLEMRPAQALYYAHYDRFREASETYGFDVRLDPPEAAAQELDLTRYFSSLAGMAQQSGVTFYGIDGSGQTATLGGSAEFSLRDAGSVGLSNYSPAWTTQHDTIAIENRQSSLRLLADQTGGALLANTRNYDSFFEDLRRNLDNYYSLGFNAPSGRDAGRHRIEVRVRRPQVKVEYQRAYFDKTAEMRLAEQTVSTLVLGAPIGDMAVQAIPGKPTLQDKKLVLPLQILVPVDALGLLPDGTDRVANLSLTVVTKDGKGNTKPAQAMELRLRLTEAQIEGATNGEANIRLLIDAEPQEIGIGVRDRTTGKTATTTISIDPGKPSG